MTFINARDQAEPGRDINTNDSSAYPPTNSRDSTVQQAPLDPSQNSDSRGSNSFPNTSGSRADAMPSSQTDGHSHSNLQSNIESTNEISRLRGLVASLEAKLQGHKTHIANTNASRYQVLYRLQKDFREAGDDEGEEGEGDCVADHESFEDEPEISYNRQGDAHLRCRMPVNNLELYLMTNPDISFLVFRDYPKTIPSWSNQRRHAPNANKKLQLPSPTSEYIYPVNEDLKEVLAHLLRQMPEFKDILDTYEQDQKLFTPYLFAYHGRETLARFQTLVSPRILEKLNLILSYVDNVLGAEYRVADELLRNGLMLPEYVKYLVKPGDILVQKEQDGYTGFIANEWLSSGTMKRTENKDAPSTSHEQSSPVEPPQAIFDLHNTGTQQPSIDYSWEIHGETLQFDGTFYWKTKILRIDMSGRFSNAEIASDPTSSTVNFSEAKPIARLNIFPLRYAPDEIKKTLERRSRTFSKCSTKNLIHYQPGESDQFKEVVSSPSFHCPLVHLGFTRPNDTLIVYAY